jgi:heme/copper-type cytochrome/quinol oxidase subunit 2
LLESARKVSTTTQKLHTHLTNPLAEPIFWIAAVICIVAEIALLRSAFVPHRQTAESLPHSQRGLEMIWAIVPAIGLAILLAATWRAVHH